jgi:osmotically-inducible protein OsmY
MSMSTPPLAAEHTSSDEALIMAVRDALGSYTPIRILGESVEIDARDGTVVLSGVVRSHASRETAGQIVSLIRGVKAVENKLVVDAEVELAVAQALAADPRTQVAFPGILVGVVFGVVDLKGQVASAEIKTAANQVASKVSGVRSVSNELATLEDGKTTGQSVPAKPRPLASATA